jgi:hypothetical protein
MASCLTYTSCIINSKLVKIMSAKQSFLKRKLKDIIETEPNTIKALVATEAIDYHDIKDFFKDLLSHGCQSGMIGSLIYYSDTHEFFDTHYREIEELRYEYEQDFGMPLQPNGDLKNWFAWFAFEETARKLVDELKIDW